MWLLLRCRDEIREVAFLRQINHLLVVLQILVRRRLRVVELKLAQEVVRRLRRYWRLTKFILLTLLVVRLQACLPKRLLTPVVLSQILLGGERARLLDLLNVGVALLLIEL